MSHHVVFKKPTETEDKPQNYYLKESFLKSITPEKSYSNRKVYGPSLRSASVLTLQNSGLSDFVRQKRFNKITIKPFTKNRNSTLVQRYVKYSMYGRNVQWADAN